jgi:hypothetical protein
VLTLALESDVAPSRTYLLSIQIYASIVVRVHPIWYLFRGVSMYPHLPSLIFVHSEQRLNLARAY